MNRSASSESLPTDLSLQSASFYSRGSSVTNIIHVVRNRNQYVTFDYDSHGELSRPQTVVAIRTESPRIPDTNLSGASGLHLQRLGPWILAFQSGRILTQDEVGAAIEYIANLLEYAKEFPQNR